MIDRSDTDRIQSIDALRGLAALAVCLFHLIGCSSTQLPSWLKESSRYGSKGVVVFFVISGFIIPHVLSKSSYSMRCFPRFMLKRIMRLDPPYLAAVGGAVLLQYLDSCGALSVRAVPLTVTMPQIYLHLGYLTGFSDYPWLSPVFWSLAIEFQYYLFIGILFPFLVGPHRAGRAFLLVLFSYLALVVRGDHLVFQFFFTFLLGMAVFRYKAGMINRIWLAALLCYGTAGVIYVAGAADAAACALAACVILFFRCSVPPVLLCLGAVSYSLYLVHWPVFIGLQNVLIRFAALDKLPPVLLVCLELSVCLLTAVLFHRAIELPSRRVSSRIRYPKAAASPHSTMAHAAKSGKVAGRKEGIEKTAAA